MLFSSFSTVDVAGISQPDWWSGECNSTNNPGSYKLGASYEDLQTCGPLPGSGWGRQVNFFPGAWGEFEWQRTELVKRYLYLKYGTAPYSANGKYVVSNYPGSSLIKTANGGTEIPSPGDVLSISYSSIDMVGHAAIVSTVAVNSSGNGIITTVEQNASPTGTREVNVVGGVLQSGVTGWLHDPQSTPFTTFQSNINTLYSRSGSLSYNTLQGMSSGTSPSTARTAEGDYVTAFRANTGALHIYNHTTKNSTVTTQGIAAGTSPSITTPGGSTWVASFQANTAIAYLYSSAVGSGQSLGMGMAANTSPAIASLSSTTHAVAVQANTGYLWLYETGDTPVSPAQGMKASTSPSIKKTISSSYYIAFQANTGDLVGYAAANGATSTNQGMASASSPSVGVGVAL